MIEPTDSPAKPPRTWRPMILSIVLIVVGAALIWAVSANWRRIEARYWLWQVRRAAEIGGERAIAERANRRRFCLLRLDLIGMTTRDGRLRVYFAYLPVDRDIFEYRYVSISADGGKTWRREWCSSEEQEKVFSRRDANYELRYERNGFSVWRADGRTGDLVRRFAGYPEFVEVHDLIPLESETAPGGEAPK